jgi:hypothetical protein
MEQLQQEYSIIEQNRKIILLLVQKKETPILSIEETKLLKNKLLKPLRKYILKLQLLREKTALLLPKEENPLQKDLTKTSQNIIKVSNQRNTNFTRNQTISLLTLLEKYLQEKQNNLLRAKELLNITSEKTISQTEIKRTIQTNKEQDRATITAKINETIQLGTTLIPSIKAAVRKWKWTKGDKNLLLEETKKDIFPQLSLYLQSILDINFLLKQQPHPFESPIKNEIAIKDTIAKINSQNIIKITARSQEQKTEQLLLLILTNCREKQRHLKTLKRKIKNLELSTDETILAKAA